MTSFRNNIATRHPWKFVNSILYSMKYTCKQKSHTSVNEILHVRVIVKVKIKADIFIEKDDTLYMRDNLRNTTFKKAKVPDLHKQNSRDVKFELQALYTNCTCVTCAKYTAVI